MAKQIDGVDIIFGDPRQPKALPLEHPKARFEEWGTKTFILKKGTVRRRGALALPCDIRFERDVPIHLRDGTKIYMDVFRPMDESVKTPALMAWSPYGKQPGKGNQVLDDFPFRMGVPLSKLSELQKWEGPDPAYWVKYGYAVCNPDARGTYNSEGDIYHFGAQEGRDGADVIDWIGSQPWCNGKVAMSGNSYLSLSQWFIASEKPKHLAAISPWEGSSDYFREASPGGVASKPALDFGLQILSVNVGKNSWENPVEMLRKHPTLRAYFEDKAAKVPEIDVPAYVVASYSNPIHSYGTFRAFSRLTSPKWLRVHDSWEWPDYYDEANRADLHRFYDRYLKDINNGWETTPQLRTKIIDTGNPLPLTGTTLTSSSFPPKEVRPLKLFFDTSNSSLGPVWPGQASGTYAAGKSELSFEYVFPSDTTVCGPLEMHLAISLAGNTDADIFVNTEKILTNGARGSQLVIPYPSPWTTRLIRLLTWLNADEKLKLLQYVGSWGCASVGRRALEEDEHVPGLPVVKMDDIKPVTEGDIVEVQPCLRPIGMLFRSGESLRVTISGVNKAVYPEVHGSTLTVEDIPDPNATGVRTTIHCGPNAANLQSFISLPIVPT